MYYILFALMVLIFIMILHINWLWDQLRTKEERQISDGFSKGVEWGVSTSRTIEIKVSDVLAVNIEIRGKTYRIYELKAISSMPGSTTVETTTYNHPEISVNTVEE